MEWYPIEALEAGKLAVLHFENQDQQRWVGYIHGDGICHWPEKCVGTPPRRLAGSVRPVLKPARQRKADRLGLVLTPLLKRPRLFPAAKPNIPKEQPRTEPQWR